MTRIIFSTLALLLLGLSACNEEITLSTNFEESPVIFGLLDQNESMHVIKINRGFVGPGDAFEFSKIPDSNYFENVSAKVDELIGGVVQRSWDLKDTLIDTKSTDGLFFGPTQKVYIFHDNNPTTTQSGVSSTGSLKEEAIYRLTVDINEGKVIVNGETKLVAGFASNTSLSNQTAGLKLAKDPGEYLPATIFGTSGTAVFGSITLEIDVAEIRGSDTTVIRIPWKIGETTTSNGQLTTTGQGETFYTQIKEGITNDNTITRRNFLGFNAKFIGGSNDFYNYILVNKPSSSLTQTKPIFTNLSVTDGFNVVGLFSARSTVSIYKPFVLGTIVFVRCIDANSTRELCQGQILGLESFCSQHPGDNITTNPKPYRCL